MLAGDIELAEATADGANESQLKLVGNLERTTNAEKDPDLVDWYGPGDAISS
jgi:hypothetical protein